MIETQWDKYAEEIVAYYKTKLKDYDIPELVLDEMAYYLVSKQIVMTYDAVNRVSRGYYKSLKPRRRYNE
jgi:hypothetical protein